jgi:putative ABC transport system permease protein
VRAGDRNHTATRSASRADDGAGIYYDYSSELGWVIMDRSTLLKYLPAQPMTNLAVYLRPGTDATEVRRRIESADHRFPYCGGGEQDTSARTPSSYSTAPSPSPTRSKAVAIIVAMLGAGQFAARAGARPPPEFGVLRFLGAAPAQIRRMVLIEASDSRSCSPIYSD